MVIILSNIMLLAIRDYGTLYTFIIHEAIGWCCDIYVQTLCFCCCCKLCCCCAIGQITRKSLLYARRIQMRQMRCECCVCKYMVNICVYEWLYIWQQMGVTLADIARIEWRTNGLFALIISRGKMQVVIDPVCGRNSYEGWVFV